MESLRIRDCLVIALLLQTLATVRQCVASVSICDTLCTCSNPNAGVFVKVDCVLDASRGATRTDGAGSGGGSGVAGSSHDHHASVQHRRFVLDGQLHLPPNASALHIRLIAGGHLAIYREFFNHDSINNLSIDGGGRSVVGPSHDASVELHERALCNNHGQYLELAVTRVGRLIINRNVSCGEYKLSISHVNDVRLRTEFLAMEQAEVLIEFVGNLQIEPNAFRGSTRPKVQIHNTTIDSLPKLGASFRLLNFEYCNISEIMSQAFDANEVEDVRFIGCRIVNLRQQAVTERLLSYSLTFRGCYLHRIEKQFVDGSGLTEFHLEDNKIDDIAAGALTYTSVNTIITGNEILRTGKDWLHQTQWTNVTIFGNSFGEFHGFSLGDRRSGADTTAGAGALSPHCLFGNNTLTNPLAGSFNFGHQCTISALHFGRVCDCEYDSWLAEVFGLPATATVQRPITSVASCQVEESLRYCFNRTDDEGSAAAAGRVNVHYFLTEFCLRQGSEKCSSYLAGAGVEAHHKNAKPPPLIPFDKIDSLGGAAATDGGLFPGGSIWWLVGCAAAVLVALCAALSVLCHRRCREGEKTNHHSMTSNRSAASSASPASPPPAGGHTGSSFTSLQRRVIAASLGWIRETLGHKVWLEIDAPMQQLLTPPVGGVLEEQQKVHLIGQIIESLDRHGITGEQMVALNDILYRHLGPPTTSGRRSPAATLVEMNDPLDHIYDELQPAGRPRTGSGMRLTDIGLLGDYAAPLDHGGGGGGVATTVPEGIYSEPIRRDDQQLLQRTGNRNFISPYAIGDATVQRNPEPGSDNLPDILLRSAAAAGSSHSWKPPTADPGDDDEDDDYDDDDDEDDVVGGEAERKTMLRPPDAPDGGGDGPTYALPMKKLKRPPVTRDDEGEIAEDSGAIGGNDGSNRSEHSGSSMQTVRIEDITDDATGTSAQQQTYGCNK